MLLGQKGDVETVRGDDQPFGYELADPSAVYQRRYKMMQNLPPKEDGSWEMFDIENDPLAQTAINAQRNVQH